MLRTRATSADPPESGARRVAALRRHQAFGRDEAGPWAASPPGEAATDGLLKLMLILLAFFVVLYSRSEVSDSKAGPVLEALVDRFAAPADEDAGSETLDGSSRADERLRRRLAASLPVQARAREIPGMLIAFDLDTADLFEESGNAVRRERFVLLRRLATALAERGDGWSAPLRVTTLLPEDAVDTARDRLLALADLLAANGLAQDELHLGFAALPANLWRFAVPRAAARPVHAD